MTAGPVLALVAVRLNSSRCPGKALADLAGSPLILRLHERLATARIPDRIIWCTSTNAGDDPLAGLADAHGIEVFRGDEMDVLSRFMVVALAHGAKHVVRVTGDNPLTDPGVLDVMVEAHIAEGAEYTYIAEADMPRGTRAEVISAEALVRCHALAEDPASSEYMTLMLRRDDHFRVQRVAPPAPDIRRGDVRLTVDTPEDLEVVRAVYEAFDGAPPDLAGIIDWLDAHPAVRDHNGKIEPRTIDTRINVRMKGD